MKKLIDKTISIVLVEDHGVVRTSLRALLELESDFRVIGEASNGREALVTVARVQPNVVVMDLALPELGGAAASARLLKTHPQLKILILSAHAEDAYVEQVLNVGVAGYLLKQCSHELLIQAIRTVSSGATFWSSQIDDRIQLLRRRPTHSPRLSTRESEVLESVARGKSNKEIASLLEISIKTVEKHRQNLMNKLGIHEVAGLTRYAIANGLISVGPSLSVPRTAYAPG